MTANDAASTTARPRTGLMRRLLGGAAAHVGSRLFRKYVALFVAVVCVALLTNGLFEIWFSYQENKQALTRIQREQAEAAAAKIGQFIKDIEGQIGWTTQLPWTASALEQRRFDALRLLRQVPAITELAQLDASGKEQLRVSRLAMDAVGVGTDFSKDPKFTEAVAKKIYYGPVYFRRESEPYMTLAMAGARRDAGVSVAEVNLKFIWDVVSQIKVGKKGQAFVIDARGRLIAHPDISLVLRNTDLSRLDYVERGAQHRRRAVAGGRRDRQRRAGPRGADRARADPAAALADVRRAADRRGLCAALRIDQAVELSADRRPDARLPRRPVPRPQDDRADPAAARGRGADRRRQSRAAHLDQDRRRARIAGRPVQRHGRTAGGMLRRPGAEGRAAHARAERVAGAADRDLARCSRSSAVRPASSSRCSRPCWRMRRASARPSSARCCCAKATRSGASRSHNAPPAFAEFRRTDADRSRRHAGSRSSVLVATKAGRPHRRHGRSKLPQTIPIAKFGGARTLRGRADAQGRRADRRHRHLPPGGSPVHRQADRAGHELRRPGRDRHRERPPAQRIARAHRRSGPLGRRVAGARRGLAGGQLDARSRTGADHHRAARGAALAHRRRRDLRVRRGAAGVQAARHLRHERGDDRRHHRPAHRHRRRPYRAGGDASASRSRSPTSQNEPPTPVNEINLREGYPRAADHAAAAPRPHRRRAGGAAQDARRIPASRPSTCWRPSPTSRWWRSRTRTCSTRSRRRASSSRSRASTSRSSSPT